MVSTMLASGRLPQPRLRNRVIVHHAQAQRRTAALPRDRRAPRSPHRPSRRSLLGTQGRRRLVGTQRGVHRRGRSVGGRAAGVQRRDRQERPQGPRIDSRPGATAQRQGRSPRSPFEETSSWRAPSPTPSTLEWPKGSGVLREYPEFTGWAGFAVAEARSKLLTGQRPLLDHLRCARRRRTAGVSIALMVSARPWIRHPPARPHVLVVIAQVPDQVGD